MSILVNKDTRLLAQGITGSAGSFHCSQMREYGTNLVAGVTPGRGGQKFEDAIPVFDTVGGAGILDSALGLTRPGGTVVLFAHAGDGETATFALNRFFKAERRVVATYSGALAEQGRIGELIADGRLDASPLVTHTLPFEAFSEAVDSVRSCRALKVLLVPGEPSAACD